MISNARPVLQRSALALISTAALLVLALAQPAVASPDPADGVAVF